VRIPPNCLVKKPKCTKVFYSPTKNSVKIYIKIALTCFGAVTPSSGSALFMLA